MALRAVIYFPLVASLSEPSGSTGGATSTLIPAAPAATTLDGALGGLWWELPAPLPHPLPPSAVQEGNSLPLVVVLVLLSTALATYGLPEDEGLSWEVDSVEQRLLPLLLLPTLPPLPPHALLSMAPNLPLLLLRASAALPIRPPAVDFRPAAKDPLQLWLLPPCAPGPFGP